MGRSPIVIVVCLCAMSLGTDIRTDVTDPQTCRSNDPLPAIIFDASPYLRRMEGVDVASLPSANTHTFTAPLPKVSDPVQSVPLPSAVFGMASLGAGWMVVRGMKTARRRFRR